MVYLQVFKTLLLHLQMLWFKVIINSFGKMAVAGCGSYSKIEGFAFLPITCFAMALTTFTSQNLGAKKYARVKKGARFWNSLFFNFVRIGRNSNLYIYSTINSDV